MYSITDEQLIELRNFASMPGAIVVMVKGNFGRVPIWAEDITKAKGDAELRRLILTSIAELR
jgi:hypothetical protein